MGDKGRFARKNSNGVEQKGDDGKRDEEMNNPAILSNKRKEDPRFYFSL